MKSGDPARVHAAIASFERKGRWMDFVEVGFVYVVVIGVLWWLDR